MVGHPAPARGDHPRDLADSERRPRPREGDIGGRGTAMEGARGLEAIDEH